MLLAAGLFVKLNGQTLGTYGNDAYLSPYTSDLAIGFTPSGSKPVYGKLHIQAENDPADEFSGIRFYPAYTNSNYLGNYHRIYGLRNNGLVIGGSNDAYYYLRSNIFLKDDGIGFGMSDDGRKNPENNIVFKVTNDGKVGIGTTTSPSAILDVHSSTTTALKINHSVGAGYGYAMKVSVNRDDTKAFNVSDSRTGATLFNVWGNGVTVAKKIYCEGIEVRSDALEIHWYDYVFEEDYDLMSLDSLSRFISQKKHLPDIPTTEEVNTEGLNLAEMDGLLLKKVEELTLYMIELKKENEIIKKKCAILEEMVNKSK